MTLPIFDRFIEGAVSTLKEDERFIALLAGGSLVAGTMDEFSDLDLIVVYDSRFRENVMAERLVLAGMLGPLLSGFTGEHVGEPRVVICLYGPPALHVDLKFVTLPELADRIENPLVLWERDEAASQALRLTEPSPPQLDPQWIEDRFWVWVHYGAAKLGRGELYELIDHLAYMRGAVLGPLMARAAGQMPRGVRKLETLAAAYARELAETVPRHHTASCYKALQATIGLYRTLRSQIQGLELRTEAEEVSVRYLDEVFAEVSERT